MSLTQTISDLGRPIAFYPELVRFLGDIPQALIVCQFLYWSGRKSGEIYKTVAELEAETALTYEQQRRAWQILKKKGYVTITKKGLPARNYYRWDWEKLDRDFSAWVKRRQGQQGGSEDPPESEQQNKTWENRMTGDGETPDPVLGKPHDWCLGNPSTTSETTAETTTETTTERVSAGGAAEHQTGALAEKKSASKTTKVWEAYARAYRDRYGIDPVRNAKVNAILTQFVKRVPAKEAPLIAEAFVQSNQRWYVQRGHAVECMLKDAEKLRTEVMTGRAITARQAAEIDAFEARRQRYIRVIQELEAEERNNVQS